MDNDRERELFRRFFQEEMSNLGVHFDTPERLERTRLNFRTVDEITEARIAARGAFRRGIIEAFSKGAGTLLWIPFMAAGTYFLPIICKAIIKALQQ